MLRCCRPKLQDVVVYSKLQAKEFPRHISTTNNFQPVLVEPNNTDLTEIEEEVTSEEIHMAECLEGSQSHAGEKLETGPIFSIDHVVSPTLDDAQDIKEMKMKHNTTEAPIETKCPAKKENDTEEPKAVSFRPMSPAANSIIHDVASMELSAYDKTPKVNNTKKGRTKSARISTPRRIFSRNLLFPKELFNAFFRMLSLKILVQVFQRQQQPLCQNSILAGIGNVESKKNICAGTF